MEIETNEYFYLLNFLKDNLKPEATSSVKMKEVLNMLALIVKL